MYHVTWAPRSMCEVALRSLGIPIRSPIGTYVSKVLSGIWSSMNDEVYDQKVDEFSHDRPSRTRTARVLPHGHSSTNHREKQLNTMKNQLHGRRLRLLVSLAFYVNKSNDGRKKLKKPNKACRRHGSTLCSFCKTKGSWRCIVSSMGPRSRR